MSPISSASTPQSRTIDRVKRTVLLLALASILAGCQAAAQERTPAVLKLREVDFFYRSSTVHLPCSALQGRIASILRTLGARDDLEVRVNGCDIVAPPEDRMDAWRTPSDRWGSPSDRWRGASSRLRGATREQSVHVRVRAMMPIEVTPEVLAEMERDKSRRELVSRVTGNPAASLNDPIVFPAERRRVTLSRRTIDLSPEECELLEQMSTSVFRKLDIRVVGGGPNCSRDEVSRIPPKITVEALMPVMPGAPQPEPAAGASEPDPGAPAASDAEPSEPSEPVTATAPDPEPEPR